MENLQIEKEKAVKIYGKADAKEKEILHKLFGKKTFDQEDWKIESFEALCKLKKIKPETVLPYVKPANDLQRALNAQAKLFLLAEHVQQEWKPDWSNTNQKKYWAYFEWGKSGFGFSGTLCDYWGANSGVGSRLCFESYEKAEWFGRQFIDILNIVLVKG